MASVLNRTTNEYKLSANTPDFPTADWLYNPDVSAVLNQSEQIPTIFWIIPLTPPQEGAVITANRIAWQRDVKINELETYRDGLLEGPFHFAKDGDHVNGNEYDPERFDTSTIITIVNSMTSGVPTPEGENGTIDWVQFFSVLTQTIPMETFTDSDFINFHSRYQQTRDVIRITYYTKLQEILDLQTEQEIIDYDVTAGWPFI